MHYLQWRFLIFSHGLLNPCPEMYDPFTSHHDKHLSTATVNASYFMAWFTIHFSLSWISLAFSFHLCLCPSQLDVHSFGFLELFFLSSTTIYNRDAKTKQRVFKNDTLSSRGKRDYVVYLETKVHRGDKDQWSERVFPGFCSEKYIKQAAIWVKCWKIRRASQIWEHIL